MTDVSCIPEYEDQLARLRRENQALVEALQFCASYTVTDYGNHAEVGAALNHIRARALAALNSSTETKDGQS